MTESATRTRTRRAILDAAVAVLARDPPRRWARSRPPPASGARRCTATSPSARTCSRRSPSHALERVAAATERAAPTHGPAPDALGRLCREYFELGDVLTLMFNEPHGRRRPPSQGEVAEHDRELSALIARGQADGSIDPALTPTWIALHAVGVALHRPGR